MAIKAPSFWWQKEGTTARLLWPISAIYQVIAGKRLQHVPPHVNVPVLCVGNYTIGGAGKTPTAIALARAAYDKGMRVGFVTRGFGGNSRSVHLIQRDKNSRSSGDEPLLLAQVAPTSVGVDRYAAAQLLSKQGCNFIIMDDGFQSRRLYYDFALIVIDKTRGLGNGLVFPSGPLRCAIDDQMRFTDALLFLGGDDCPVPFAGPINGNLPKYHARAEPFVQGEIGGRRVLAFAGIAHPDKFFRSVSDLGGHIVISKAYPDHHFFSARELTQLHAQARAENLLLVTTAKDFARLRYDANINKSFAHLLDSIIVLDVHVVFDDHSAATTIIDAVLRRYEERRTGSAKY